VKDRAIAIVKSSFGDDLERAQQAFRRFSVSEMDEQFGQSGKSRRQILAAYERDREERRAVVRWLGSLP